MRIGRVGWDKYFMLQAHLAATRSTCDRGPELFFDPGRHGVGCVIVRDKRVIAGGYNGSPPKSPHCSDPPELLRCRKCTHEFTGVERRISVNSGLDVCPECGQCVHVDTLHGGHILVDGHCIRTIHAEMNALLQCALDSRSPAGSDLYTTAYPCYDCAKLIARAGIVKVFYGELYDSRYTQDNNALPGELLKAYGIGLRRVPLRRESFEE